MAKPILGEWTAFVQGSSYTAQDSSAGARKSASKNSKSNTIMIGVDSDVKNDPIKGEAVLLAAAKTLKFIEGLDKVEQERKEASKNQELAMKLEQRKMLTKQERTEALNLTGDWRERIRLDRWMGKNIQVEQERFSAVHAF